MADKQKSVGTSIRRADVSKAGKRSGPWHRPPRATRTPQELDARDRRRQRLDGAFGAAPLHIYNELRLGTNGPERVNTRMLSARAAAIKAAQGVQDD